MSSPEPREIRKTDSLGARLEKSAGFRLLSRAIVDALLILDRDERIVYVGETIESLLGTSRDTLMGRPLRSLIEPDDLDGLPNRIEDDGGPWEVRFKAGDASEWVSIAARDPSKLGGPDANGDILEHLEGHVLLFLRTIGEERVSRDRLDLYRRAMDATNNVLVISDARQEDNPIVFVNEHFIDVTGYSRVEIVGQNCRFLQTRGDGTRDGDQEGVRQLARAIAAEEAVHVRIRNYRKDGTLFWNDLFVTPIRSESGEVTHFVGVQNDITDQVEAERDRDEQRTLLDAFYTSSPLLMGVVEVHADDILIRSANAQSEGPYGDDPGRLHGQTLAALGRSDADRAYWAKLFNEAIQTGQTIQTTTSVPVHPGPEDRSGWYNVTVAPLKNSEGAPLAMFLLDEITEQRDILRQQADLTTALEQASDGVIITDAALDTPGPMILYVNRAFERMTGYTREEVIGRDPRFMQGEMTGRVELDRMRRQLKAGEPYRGELVNYTKDGEPYFVEVEIAPVRDEEGVVRRFVSTQRDVTSRRRLEREVLQATTSAQEQIARDLHDGLGQVLTGTAFHLHGVAEQLRSSGSPLVTDIERAASLIQDAQSQTRALAHSLYPLSVRAGSFFDALRQLAEEASATYDIHCTFATTLAEPVESTETAGHLYRIAQEALVNAIRHGKPSAVHIRLASLPAVPGTMPQAILSIEDDGKGIGDLVTSGGMGMSTMQYRARQIGGVFKIDSLSSGGTVVQIQFPLGQGEQAPVDIYRG